MLVPQEPPPGGGYAPPPPLPQGPPPPMYAFGGGRSSRHPDMRERFSFAPPPDPSIRYPAERGESSRTGGSYSGRNGSWHESRQARGPTGRDSNLARESDSYRGRGNRRYAGRYRNIATSERPLMNTERGSTPEMLAGMGGRSHVEGGKQNFTLAIVISDSDEQDMDVASTSGSTTDHKPSSKAKDGEVAEERPQKRQRHKKVEGDSAVISLLPTWSNPDPYTVLPPPDESRREKKDVVQLLRTAKIATDQGHARTKSVAANDDFISFSFGESDDVDGKSLSHATSEAHKRPKAPYQGGVSHDSSIKGAPIPPVQPSDVGLAPPTNAALGNRKRTHDDEIRESRPRSDPRQSRGTGPKQTRYKALPLHSLVPQWSLDRSTDPTPWNRTDHSDTTHMGFWLHKEICDFHNFVKPRFFEEEMRNGLIERVGRVLERAYPGSKLNCFGSFAAGLYLPDADMDLVLLSRKPWKDDYPTFQIPSDLFRVSRILKQKAGAQDVTVIAKAKVPIIKFVDKLTGLKVDLAFDNDSGLRANKTFQDWKRRYPAMPIIVVLIKQLLAMRGLNDVSTRGLGGFSVTCLVVSMLQMMPSDQSGDMNPEQRLGDLLMEFLDLYGNKFNTRLTGICLDPPGYFEKSKNPHNLPYRQPNSDRLSILDPNRGDNDISGGTALIVSIFGLFAQIHRALQDKMERLHFANMEDRRGASILGIFLAGDYSNFTVQRAQLQRLHERR